MKVLITGFDKFGNDSINPSEIAVNMLPDKIEEIKIKKVILPTVFNNYTTLKNEIESYKPHIIIHVGQAGGSKNIRIERVAINIDDARIADNLGNKPVDETIQKQGDTAYFSTLPIKSIVKQLQIAGVPSEVSNSAGTFVCNHTMYQSLYITNTYYPNIRSGFVHIPYIPSQLAGRKLPAMELEIIVKALEIIIKTAVLNYNKKDIKYESGKVD